MSSQSFIRKKTRTLVCFCFFFPTETPGGSVHWLRNKAPMELCPSRGPKRSASVELKGSYGGLKVDWPFIHHRTSNMIRLFNGKYYSICCLLCFMVVVCIISIDRCKYVISHLCRYSIEVKSVFDKLCFRQML